MQFSNIRNTVWFGHLCHAVPDASLQGPGSFTGKLYKFLCLSNSPNDAYIMYNYKLGKELIKYQGYIMQNTMIVGGGDVAAG